MIGWSTIGPALQDVFSEIAVNRNNPGSATYRAQWIDGKKPWQDGRRLTIVPERGFAVGLTITSVSAIGGDDARAEEVTVDDVTTVTESQTGQRKFTLQIQALSVASGVNDDFAAAITERIRTRLTSRRTVDQLLELDVDVIDNQLPSVPLTHRDGNRMITSATMDVVFGCTASEDDPVAVGWIQYLVISSHLEGENGVDLPTGQQMANVEVPAIPTP